MVGPYNSSSTSSRSTTRSWESLTFPAPIHDGNLWSSLAIGGLVFLLGYSIPNHFHLYQPQTLPMGVIDQMTPLVPWTIWIYLSEYIFHLCAFFMMGNASRNRMLWTLLFIDLVSIFFFVFYPTTYPRGLFPLPEDTSLWFSAPFQFLRTIDDPSNSFPSLHVSACLGAAFIFWKEERWKFILYMIWSGAIAVSTLTTKQHYLVDVIGGTAISSFFAYWFVIKGEYKAEEGIIVRRRSENSQP